MILERGDMFQMWGKTDVFLVTTNPIVTRLGKAVMGRGIAKQIADRYPELPFAFGSILTGNFERSVWDYIGTIGKFDDQLVGYFMVKDHWAEPAKTSIIQSSANGLSAWVAWALNYNPSARFDLNFPGIGNGKLAREDVLPIIEQLPDNVHVWEYA